MIDTAFPLESIPYRVGSDGKATFAIPVPAQVQADSSEPEHAPGAAAGQAHVCGVACVGFPPTGGTDSRTGRCGGTEDDREGLRRQPDGVVAFSAGFLEAPRVIAVVPSMRVWVAVEPVDFRNGIDGLVAVCRQRLEADPMSGALFVFGSRRRRSIKMLAYDGYRTLAIMGRSAAR